jgi:hypothetical protein
MYRLLRGGCGGVRGDKGMPIYTSVAGVVISSSGLGENGPPRTSRRLALGRQRPQSQLPVSKLLSVAAGAADLRLQPHLSMPRV